MEDTCCIWRGKVGEEVGRGCDRERQRGNAGWFSRSSTSSSREVEAELPSHTSSLCGCYDTFSVVQVGQLAKLSLVNLTTKLWKQPERHNEREKREKNDQRTREPARRKPNRGEDMIKGGREGKIGTGERVSQCKRTDLLHRAVSSLPKIVVVVVAPVFVALAGWEMKRTDEARVIHLLLRMLSG